MFAGEGTDLFVGIDRLELFGVLVLQDCKNIDPDVLVRFKDVPERRNEVKETRAPAVARKRIRRADVRIV